ncbi:hypothetical protein RN001_008319 [Aquatica leii]|uniref:Uncharacterized protein n=1 Tax=Aquatica leii TaxID=1421715 RepID=A0AAN7QIX8_9COLE|nr:hypothetical protein RN001_008319 [Aquatica leii]
MRLLFYITTALLVTYSACDDEFNWSWNNDDDFKPSHNLNQDEIETAESSVTSQISDNSTVVETIVDNILSSNRQGRNLNGYDELYSDPNVQEALQNGDDREARNVIKEKLCSLGLMQCEGEFIQGKRPYISPEELVYAQPVDIKPIGRPIPSIPVKQPIRNLNHYGPPRPNPIPPKFGPPLSPNSPPRRGYGPPQNHFTLLPPNKPFPSMGPPIRKLLAKNQKDFCQKPPEFLFHSQPIELRSLDNDVDVEALIEPDFEKDLEDRIEEDAEQTNEEDLEEIIKENEGLGVLYNVCLKEEYRLN